MPINVAYYIEDGKSDESPLTINLPSGTSAADAVAFAQTMWPLVDALINGGNVVAKVIFEVPGITSSNPIGSSDVQEIAKFVFNTANTIAKKAMGIPTFIESKILPGTKLVDTTDVDVAAFVTAMVDGLDTTGNGGSGVIQPCNLYDFDLTSLRSAVETWGKERK